MRDSDVLDNLRQELQATAEELDRQLLRVRQPAEAFEAAPAGDRLEGITEDYLRLSDATADAIMDAADEQDEQAVSQFTRLIGLDLEVAQRLVGRAAFEPDDDAGGGPEAFVSGEPDATWLAELDALPALGSVATEALQEPPRRATEGGAESAPTAKPADIDTPIGSILDEAGKTVTSTVKAVAWANVADDFASLAGRIGGPDVQKTVEKVVGAARGLWKRASKLAAKVLGAIVDKITKFLGAERFRKVVDAVKDKISGWWKDVPGDGVASQGLGLALQRNAVRDECEELLEGRSPEEVGAAVAAAKELGDAQHDALKWVRRGNKALDWAGAVKPFVRISGADVLLAIVGVALATYTVWVAHDYLDSPTLADRIPDRVKGVRQTVAAAVAG